MNSFRNFAYVNSYLHLTILTGKNCFIQFSIRMAFFLRDRHVFMWQSVKISNLFNTLTFKQIFWKTKTLFKKREYRLLVERTKIQNASFPYKTAISEASVKTNRMVTTKWIYHKERIFASNYFIFWKFCFSLRTFYEDMIWCINDPDAQFLLFVSAGVLFNVAYSLWVSLKSSA